MSPELLHRVAQKDSQALAELYAETARPVANCVRSIVRDTWNAEEVVQDIYQYVWHNAAAYRHDRGTPAAWLFMIARSRALDSVRRSTRGPVLAILDDQICGQSLRDVEESQSRARALELLRRGVDDLPPVQKHMISLAFFDGYSHSEIARVTSVPLGTVKTRIRMALANLRHILEAETLDAQAA